MQVSYKKHAKMKVFILHFRKQQYFNDTVN